MAAHSREYDRALGSAQWRERRQQRISEAKGRCERCGSVADRPELHHRTYDRLGQERPDDLELLCSICHGEADRERAQEVAEERWSRRVESYALSKYGEDWFLLVDHDQAEAEFSDWVEQADE